MSTSFRCRGPESVAAASHTSPGEHVQSPRHDASGARRHFALRRPPRRPPPFESSRLRFPRATESDRTRNATVVSDQYGGCLAGRKVIRSAHEEGGWLRDSLKCSFTTEVGAAGMRARCLLTQESLVAHTSHSRAGRPCVCLTGRDWNATLLEFPPVRTSHPDSRGREERANVQAVHADGPQKARQCGGGGREKRSAANCG